jgi:uncharacterized protein (DUF924 family)
MSADERAIDELLGFWFGSSDDDVEVAQDQARLWWSHDPAVDAEITERFGALVSRAAAGEVDHWAGTARGRLALILLLDQLPRNIHRGTPQAFATDRKALALSREGLRLRADQELRPIERVFLMMPLEHAEDIEAQQECVQCFRALANEVPESSREIFEYYLDYAVRHHDVVARFGRFPHRNQTLGRPSTPEETSFLEEPDSSF